MAKTLTITIENIPEGALNEIWRNGIKMARIDLGVPIQQTDHIQLDFDKFHYDPATQIMSELVGAAISGTAVMEADKILNS